MIIRAITTLHITSTYVDNKRSNMVESPISFRLSKEEMGKLESIRGEKSASAFCKDIVVQFLSTSVDKHVDITDITDITNTARQLQKLQEEIDHKNELLEMAKQRVSDLQIHNGFLINQIQQQNQQLNRLLLPEPQPQQQEVKKAWWRVW